MTKTITRTAPEIIAEEAEIKERQRVARIESAGLDLYDACKLALAVITAIGGNTPKERERAASELKAAIAKAEEV